MKEKRDRGVFLRVSGLVALLGKIFGGVEACLLVCRWDVDSRGEGGRWGVLEWSGVDGVGWGGMGWFGIHEEIVDGGSR